MPFATVHIHLGWRQHLSCAVGLAALSLAPGTHEVRAAGFAIIEQSATVASYAAAGAAALAEDASAQAYNPALLTELEGITALTGAGVTWQLTDFNDSGRP